MSYLGVVSDLGEEVEAQPTLHTTCTTPPLSSIAPCYERLDKSADLSLLVETHFTMLSGVNDTGNIRDRDARLGDVGRYTYQKVSKQYAQQSMRSDEPMTIFRTPGGGMSNTAPCWSLEIVECRGYMRK